MKKQNSVTVLLPYSKKYNSESANILWLFKEALRSIGLSCGFFIPGGGDEDDFPHGDTALKIIISKRRN